MKAMTTVAAHEHERHLRLIKRSSRPNRGFPIQKYLGTTHKIFNVAVPDLRKIASNWSREHRDISRDQLTELVDKLFLGESREEKVVASMILSRFPDALKRLSFRDVNRWLGGLSGWEEVDSFCDELAVWVLANQKKRLPYLSGWAKSKQIEKQRTSLVVLCSAVRVSDNQKLADLSFELINQLKIERGMMIIKAVSWLLRSLLKHHRKEVQQFLKEHRKTLPAIAVRETTKKLETGKK